MDSGIGPNIFLNLIHEHWLSAFLILVTLTTIGVLLVLRWYVRRRLRTMLDTRFAEEHELDLLPSPGEKEKEALTVIAAFREEVWALPENDLQPTLDPLTKWAVKIVRAIGAVYHPESEQPEFEATLGDTIELVKRVSTRLTGIASAVPFKYLGGRKISDFQRYYQVYQKINESSVLKIFKKNPYIYKAAKLVLNVKNISNPLYWAGRELSREGYFFVLRWFYLSFTSEIGKEAIRLFNGNRFQRDEDRDAAVVCYRLFHTVRKWGGPSPSEWAAFVFYVAKQSALDSDAKLHILARCSEDRLPKDIAEQKITTKSGTKWYKEGLKVMLDADTGAPAAKAKLIEKESGDTASAG